MNAARAYTRLKEVEERKLANRLSLLKLELEKSKKKVNETKQRTDAILAQKSKIRDRYKAKREEMERREEERKVHMELNVRARERMAELRRANVMDVVRRKKQEADIVKLDRVRNEELICRQKELELERAAEVKRLIREQREAGAGAREREIERKIAEAREDFNRRIKTEAEKSAASEARVAEMEKMEMELIKSLEQAQEEQRQAYASLEQALLSSKKKKAERPSDSSRKSSARQSKRGTPVAC